MTCPLYRNITINHSINCSPPFIVIESNISRVFENIDNECLSPTRNETHAHEVYGVRSNSNNVPAIELHPLVEGQGINSVDYADEANGLFSWIIVHTEEMS